MYLNFAVACAHRFLSKMNGTPLQSIILSKVFGRLQNNVMQPLELNGYFVKMKFGAK